MPYTKNIAAKKLDRKVNKKAAHNRLFFSKMDLIKIRNNIREIDINLMAKQTIEEMKDFITNLNKEQVEKYGIKHDEKKLKPPYAESTKKRKKKKSGIAAITSHVTLFDSKGIGEFLDTDIDNENIFLKLENMHVNGFDLGTHLMERYGELTGLTEKSKQIFAKEFNKRFAPKFWNAIQK